jgi:hypothetical protein
VAYLIAAYQNAGDVTTARTMVLRINLLDAGTAGPAAGGVTAVGTRPQAVSSSGLSAVQIRYTLAGPDTALSGMFCSEVDPAMSTNGTSGVSPTPPCIPGSALGYANGSNFIATGNTGRESVQVPPGVTQLAYQRALQSGKADLFFVRQFASGVYAVQHLRLAGNAANRPFTLTRVELAFKEGGSRQPVTFVARDGVVSPLAAFIDYQGAGLLKGRWEVVQPGDPEPTALDLTPESELTAMQRIQQKRYTEVGSFEQMTTAGSRLALEGPPPSRLPTAFNGRYLVLLRLESSRDNNTADANADNPEGVSLAYALPVLTYYVTEKGAISMSQGPIRQTMQALEPTAGSRINKGGVLRLRWKAQEGATLYRIEITDTRGELLFAARIKPAQTAYELPTKQLGLGQGELRWRVMALDTQGQVYASSPSINFLFP